jgi:hypothetical protein
MDYSIGPRIYYKYFITHQPLDSIGPITILMHYKTRQKLPRLKKIQTGDVY